VSQVVLDKCHLVFEDTIKGVQALLLRQKVGAKMGIFEKWGPWLPFPGFATHDPSIEEGSLLNTVVKQ